MDAAFTALLSAVEKQKSLTPRTHQYLQRLMEMLEPDVLEINTAVHKDAESKQVNIDFPESLIKQWPCLELIQIGDVQFGHKDCKIPRVREYRDWVLAKPYRFVLFTGDMIDAAHAFTPGSPWDNIFGAQSQVYQFCQIFAPMRHRILGYVGGNHERRGIPVFGDLGILLATMLKVPYSGGRQYLNLRFGKHQPFRILLWHGHPRARTKGALAQIIDRFMQIGNAQLYLTGHNHQAMIIPSYREVSEHGRIRLEKVIGASCTSFLETYGSYGEFMGFGAYDVLMSRGILEKDGKWELTVR